MKISIFLSGEIRTLFYCFPHNLKIIKEQISTDDIDIFYSFWNIKDRSHKINDPWHYKIEQQFLDIDVDNFFKNCNIKNAHGEIEDIKVMEDIKKQSPFESNFLSSQYYKTKKVSNFINKTHKKYDICLRLRPDILINKFPNYDQLNEIIFSDSLLVNHYYWYNEPYKNNECNEMIWLSNQQIFFDCNNLYDHQYELSNNILKQKQFGEYITGYYFNNLLNFKKIKNIKTFNFDYRVVR